MSTMRILILGILNRGKPMHGYEIKQELESWEAEQWTNISYGSIYFALKTMAKDGLIAQLEQENQDAAEKVIYEITEAGRKSFLTMLREQWFTYKPAKDPFQVAVAFMNYMSKDELLIALEHRANAKKVFIKTMEHLTPIRIKEQQAPAHIVENFNLSIAHIKAELGWIESLIEKIKAGQVVA